MLNKIKIFGVFIFMLSASGCFKDLDSLPLDPDILTADVVYQDPAAYKQVLAKLYAGFAVSGQQGPAGQADIAGIDEGFGQYLRGYWYHQELPTDEAVIGWNDQTIKDFHGQTWTESDGFIYAFYSRIFYQVALANEYLRETTDEKLNSRGVDDALKSEIKRYRAEARFLRALSYWHALDLFRNVPFATDEDVVGSVLPEQTNATDLFAFIETELKAIEPDLADPRTNEYGRADKAGAWMLLAKLYLNSEVYGTGNHYEDCLNYCDRIINAGFELEPNYQDLFLSDNHKSKEVIFPVLFDGVNTRTWGGMTFIIRAGIGGSMNAAESGVASGWGGTRTTRQLVEKFPTDLTGIKVDFNTGQRSSYAKLYVPGSHQGFDATDTDNSLTATAIPNNKIYEGHIYFPDANNQILFTQISSNTAPKFGDNGPDGILETGGANISVPESGMHYMTVNLNTKAYSIQKRVWSIVGSATNGEERVMTWDSEKKLLVANGPLVVGSFKFRANNSDAITLGDSNADAILESGGGEIAITESGGYKVYLDVSKLDYTYQLQLTSFDRRGLFYTDGQSIDIDDLTLFTHGYAVRKFKNVTSEGVAGSDTDFPDTDFPMFRLADVYLMAAEAVLRGAGGGDKTRAAGYANKVRERAYTGTSGNYDADELELSEILNERARELYWECHRRTDLVRFNQFTDGSYLWAWKGGVKEGASVGAYRNIYPIPAADRSANPNLNQNTGY